MPALREGESPDFDAVEAQIELANENPSHGIGLDLSEREGGAGAGPIVQDRDPFSVTLFANNAGDTSTGRLRAGVEVRHDNLFERGHIGTVTAAMSPTKPDRVKQVGLSYTAPIPEWGDSVVVTAS